MRRSLFKTGAQTLIFVLSQLVNSHFSVVRSLQTVTFLLLPGLELSLLSGITFTLPHRLAFTSLTTMSSTFTYSTSSKASCHTLRFCSTSSSSSPFGGSVHVDSHGFLKSSHRVGGPTLCSLPTLTKGNIPFTIAGLSLRTEDRTVSILGEHGLEFIYVRLVWRISKVDPEPEPILIVQVRKTSTNPFITAARDLHEILTYFDLADVDVLFQRDSNAPLIQNPTLYGEMFVRERFTPVLVSESINVPREPPPLVVLCNSSLLVKLNGVPTA